MNAFDVRMMSSSSPVSLREQNNNNNTSNSHNNNNSGRLTKANSFSFRRRYFLKSSNDDPPTPPPSNDDSRQSTFIRPQSQAIQPRTTLSLRSFRSSLDSNSGFTRKGFVDKNSNHSYPTSPTSTNSTIRTSSSSCSTPPVSPHRIPIFRNSMPKTGVSSGRGAALNRMTGVQQLSTSWEFIR